jgi:N-acetylglutamate synthase-like GNAT family acetyltransferase
MGTQIQQGEAGTLMCDANEPEITIRTAKRQDLPYVVELLRMQAEHHAMLDDFELTAQALESELFSSEPMLHCRVIEASEKIVAVVTWIYTYSTFSGRRCLHVEDFFVNPAHRSGRVGYAAISYLARLSVKEGLGRLQAVTQKRNSTVQACLTALGAKVAVEWIPWQWQVPEMLKHSGASSNYSAFRNEMRAAMVHYGRATRGRHDDA